MAHEIGDIDQAVFGCKEQQIPGLKREMTEVKNILNGDGKTLGLIQKVGVIWRVHVWLLCAFSGILGSALTLLIQRLSGHS